MDVRKVVTCFLENEGKILILRRSERVSTYQGRWAGVSGYIEEGVSADEQALVEIGEEVGLGEEDIELVRRGEPLEVVDEGLHQKWIVHPYRFAVMEREKVRIDWEHKEALWIEPADITDYETVPMLWEAWERVAG